MHLDVSLLVILRKKKCLILNTELLNRSLLRLALACILQFLFLGSFAADRSVKSARLIADTSGMWFLNGVLPVGYELTYENGRKRRTTGFLNGNLGWKKCNLTSDQGELKSGYFIIDLAKAEANQRSVVIELSMSNPLIKQRYTFKLPELTAIALLVPEKQQLMPGVQFSPEVNFAFSNGRRYQSDPWSKESLISGNELQLYANKELVENGVVVIPENILEAGDRITLSILWKQNRSLFDVRIFALEFNFLKYLRYKRETAMDGLAGKNGISNQKGMTGEQGQTGQAGRTVDVFMWLDDSDGMLHVQTTCDEFQDIVLLKPGIGKVEIEVQGGKGGNGGDGGKGGNASSDSGDMGGIGGDGGNGGNGGAGGIVKIWCDSLATKYLSQLNINNLGGAGGFGGKGGKGGRTDEEFSSFLFSMLFPSRNSSGNDGEAGQNGQRGPEAEISIESVDVVRRRCNK